MVNNSKILISILAISNLFIGQTFGESGGAANGGDAVICPDKVILLDSYEASKMRFNIDLNPNKINSPTWRSMVNIAVKRLSRVDKYTADKLYDYAMEMVNDFEKFEMYPDSRGKHVYIGYDIIGEINDSDHVSMPEGCEEHPRQLVSQRKPKFKYEFRYEFSKSLWEKMSLQEQSMTILHEAWYRIMLENGATTSRAARYINGFVASVEFESIEFFEYLELLKETEIKYYNISGASEAIKTRDIKLNLKKHIFNLVQGEVCAPNFQIDMKFKQTFTILNRAQKYYKNTKFTKMCFENSQITRLVMSPQLAKKNITLRLPFHQVQFDGASNQNPTIHFTSKGRLSHFSGMKFKNLVEMYYICGGQSSFTRNKGCEKGPFINHDTKVKTPINILFNESETPFSHFQR